MKRENIIDASVTGIPHRPRDRKEYEAMADRREKEGDGAAQGCKDRIMRRTFCGKGLSACEQQLNAGIRQSTHRIERTLDAMLRWFHGVRRCTWG